MKNETNENNVNTTTVSYIFEQELENSRAYRTFINAIKSQATQEAYKFYLKKYMQFYNIKNPDDLLLDRHNPTAIEDKIIDWLMSMRKDPRFTVSFGTRHTYLAGVIFFYDINDVMLRRKKISRFLGPETTRKRKDRAYTTEEIKKILEYTDVRSRVIVLLLASTGIRLGAIAELKIRHLTKVSEPNNLYSLYKISIYENTKDEYYTFCTPECAIAIDNYLEYRQKSGERIIRPDAPLIRERFDRYLAGLVGGPNGIETFRKPKALVTRGISEILYSILLRSGIADAVHSMDLMQIRRGTERKAVKKTHGFRKFFDTNLIRADVKTVVKEMLLGHDTGLDGVYYKPEESEVMQEYVKSIDFLTINNEHRLQKQVVELTQKQDDLEYLKFEHRKKDNKLKELEDRIKLSEQSATLQNSMLEMITDAMNIDTTKLKQQLDKIVPKDQCEDVDYQRVRRGIELVEKSKNKIVKDLMMPEVNNVAKNIVNNPKEALASAERVLSNKERKRFRKECNEYMTKDPIQAYVYGYDDDYCDKEEKKE